MIFSSPKFIAAFFGLAVMTSSGQLLMKLGMSQVGQLPSGVVPIALALLKSPLLMLSLVMYALSAIGYMFLLRVSDVSAIYPMYLATCIIIVQIVATLFMGESINALKAAGLVTIMAGIAMIWHS